MSNKINTILINVNHIKHNTKTKHNPIGTENIVNDINTTEKYIVADIFTTNYTF